MALSPRVARILALAGDVSEVCGEESGRGERTTAVSNANEIVDAYVAAHQNLQAALESSLGPDVAYAVVKDRRGCRWGMSASSRREGGRRLFVEVSAGRWREQFGARSRVAEVDGLVFVHEFDQQCNDLNVLTASLRDDAAVVP